MRDMLIKLPEVIKTQRLALLESAKKIEELSITLKKWEAAQMEDIANATKDGKPAFSNVEKRQAELARRKEASPWVVDVENRLAELKSNTELARIDLQYNIDTQENYRAIARLGGGEV
jgi:DNA helicase IV